MSDGISGSDVDLIRVDVREVMTSRKLTGAEVSRQSGVAYATLNAWLNSTYKGDNARVANDLANWLRNLQEHADRRAVSMDLPDYVPTETSEKFVGVLGHAQFVPDMVVITGAPGVGKTRACRQYQRTHSNVWMVTGIPSAASTHAMLEMIIGVMGIQEGAPNRRSGAIVRRARGTRGLIVVDEAQHLTSAALDELRSLHDAAEIGLALVGNETVFARIDGGGRKAQFAQVFSRIGMRIARAKSTARDVDALLDAAGIAGAPERKLLRAIASKPGALRAVAKTLRVAHMLAAEEGAPIAESHLLAAWERLSDDGRPVEAL